MAKTRIGNVTISGPANVAFGGTGSYSAAIEGDATNLSYRWNCSYVNDVTFSAQTADACDITFGAQGVQCRQTIFCEVLDATSTDYCRIGSLGAQVL